jgi:hypothetical protein
MASLDDLIVLRIKSLFAVSWRRSDPFAGISKDPTRAGASFAERGFSIRGVCGFSVVARGVAIGTWSNGSDRFFFVSRTSNDAECRCYHRVCFLSDLGFRGAGFASK